MKYLWYDNGTGFWEGWMTVPDDYTPRLDEVLTSSWDDNPNERDALLRKTKEKSSESSENELCIVEISNFKFQI